MQILTLAVDPHRPFGNAQHTFDARHNTPRIGRIVLGYGRDAADVPITMGFGPSELKRFDVVTDEVTAPEAVSA